jgi:uncharacterized delta-60 repeat protein
VKGWRHSIHVGRWSPAFLALALLVVLCACGTAQAARPGALDRSFGNDGRVKADTYASANALRIGSRGRIVLTGGSFQMARYWPTGALDRSFGDDGLASTAFPPPSEGYVSGYARSMAVDSQRRIVLAGSQCYYEDADHYKRTGCEIALTRHNPDGSTDESFGDGGTLEDGCPGSCYGESVAIDSQDRIVLASRIGNRSVLTRYDVDGNVDGSFGDGGQVTTRFFVSSVAIDSEGRIVAAGDNGGVFGVARFESDGKLDDSFGSGGITTTEFGRGGGASEVALRPGGRIVAAGGSDGRFALVRYRPNGKLDHTFSRDGKLTTSFGHRHHDRATATAVAADSRGRVVAAGGAFKLARYKKNGRLDPSFGEGGKVVSSFGHGYHGGARDAAIDPQDRIYVAGGHTHFLLARFIGYRRR